MLIAASADVADRLASALLWFPAAFRKPEKYLHQRRLAALLLNYCHTFRPSLRPIEKPLPYTAGSAKGVEYIADMTAIHRGEPPVGAGL